MPPTIERERKREEKCDAAVETRIYDGFCSADCLRKDSTAPHRYTQDRVETG